MPDQTSHFISGHIMCCNYTGPKTGEFLADFTGCSVPYSIKVRCPFAIICVLLRAEFANNQLITTPIIYRCSMLCLLESNLIGIHADDWGKS